MADDEINADDLALVDGGDSADASDDAAGAAGDTTGTAEDRADVGDKGKTTTLLSDPDKAAADPVTHPADWPEDWRDRMAAGDDKLRKRLDRFKSPLDVAAWGVNAEKKYKQGVAPSEFPAGGTDDEKKAWRAEHGIPDDPKDYLKDIKLDDGLVIGDRDKPMVEEFAAAMHEENADPKYVQRSINAYFRMRDKMARDRMDNDERQKMDARDALRDEFGNEFHRNLTAAYGLVESAPEEGREQLMGARLADGTALGNHAPTLRWLTGLALEINPAATVAPGSRGDGLSVLQDRKTEIERIMRDDRDKYDRDPKMRAEYRDLLEAEEKFERRRRA